MATQMLTLSQPQPSLIRRVLMALRSYTLGPYSSRDPVLAKLFGDHYRTHSGIPVTHANAFMFSAVYAAVNMISSDVAKLPLILRKRTQDGGSDDFTASRLYNLLKIAPNPEMSSMQFRRTITAHALTCHGGYAEIERNGLGQPTALWILTPDRVRPFRQQVFSNNLGDYELGPLQYEIDGKDVLPARDVLHIRGLGYDGYCGYSLIDKARNAIGLALAAEAYGASFFGNGSMFGGVLSTTIDLDEDQQNQARALVEKYHQSAERAHRLLVLGGDWKYQQLGGVDPQKAQMDELRNKQIEEVARFWRIPPHKLGVDTKTASYSSVEMANLEYYTGVLLDWITTWEQEITLKLIPSLEWSQQYVKHNVNAFLRADIKTRFESYGMMLDRGVFNADDVLQLEDMNPQQGGLGKMYLVQGAQVPKQQIVDINQAKIDKDQADADTTRNPPALPTPPDTQAEINAANERATKAEEAAAEARAAAEAEKARRIAAEASGASSQAEVERLLESERAASLLAAQMTTLANDLKADVEKRQATLDAVHAELVQTAKEKGAADVRATKAEEDAASAKQTADEWKQHAEASEHAAADARAEAERALATHDQAVLACADADERARVAEQKVSEAVAALAVAEQGTVEAIRKAGEDLAAARVERDAAVQAAVDRSESESAARAAASDLAAASDRLAAEAAADAKAARDAEAAAKAEAEAIKAESERMVAMESEKAAQALSNLEQLRATLDKTEAAVASIGAAREQAEATLAALRISSADVEHRLEQAQVDVSSAQARAQAEADAKAAAERERDETRQASADTAAAVLSAHRALIVDVMRRMIDREADRLRRAQTSPEKLEQALGTFYEGHEELCQTALLPAIRVHLAWTGSDEDPVALTRRLVSRHIEDSIRQVRTVLEGDAGELAVSLNSLFRSWEAERVNQIADVILERGLDHARRR